MPKGALEKHQYSCLLYAVRRHPALPVQGVPVQRPQKWEERESGTAAAPRADRGVDAVAIIAK